MFILSAEGHFHGRFPWVTGMLVFVNAVIFSVQVLVGESFTNGYSLVPEEITSLQDLQGTRVHKIRQRNRAHAPGQNATVLARLGSVNENGGIAARLSQGKALQDAFNLEQGAINSMQDMRPAAPPAQDTGHDGALPVSEVAIKHYPGPTPIFLTLVTSMFMHNDVVHLFGNTWFLLIFGCNVECALGHKRFLAFYILCGISAALALVWGDPHSIMPSMGASGAISGVLGAYVAIHPFARVKIWAILSFMEIPALVVIGFWLLLQYISTFLTVQDVGLKGVAYWNHLAGFAAGVIIVRAVVLSLRLQQICEKLSAKKEDAATPDVPRAQPADPFANFLPPPIPSQQASR